MDANTSIERLYRNTRSIFNQNNTIVHSTIVLVSDIYFDITFFTDPNIITVTEYILREENYCLLKVTEEKNRIRFDINKLTVIFLPHEN